MTKPRSWILSSALALAAASAGCGDSGNAQPLLALGENNATSVAAEALITLGQANISAPLPSDFPSGVASTLRSLGNQAVERWAALATGAQNADGTTTTACAAGGSLTVVTVGAMVTFTFDSCSENGIKTSGTLRFTAQLSGVSNDISLTASFNLTITQGALSFAESGGYTNVIKIAQNPTDNTEDELTGDHISMTLSVGGKQRDQITMSSFDIDISQQLTSTGQQVQHFTYDIDSSWLQGHIGVMTTQDIKQLIDLLTPRQYPFAGQIAISGASATRLQITILGDEKFTPPAGQGQIELQIDSGTGAFGAPIWTSWSELSAMIMN